MQNYHQNPTLSEVFVQLSDILHGPSMLAVRQKFMECSINNPALSLLMKHLVIGRC